MCNKVWTASEAGNDMMRPQLHSCLLTGCLHLLLFIYRLISQTWDAVTSLTGEHWLLKLQRIEMCIESSHLYQVGMISSDLQLIIVQQQSARMHCEQIPTQSSSASSFPIVWAVSLPPGSVFIFGHIFSIDVRCISPSIPSDFIMCCKNSSVPAFTSRVKQ